MTTTFRIDKCAYVQRGRFRAHPELGRYRATVVLRSPSQDTDLEVGPYRDSREEAEADGERMVARRLQVAA